ncbi:MAG: protoglobin domain-containing protein [Pseudomonadota bacterium]
MDPFEAFLKEHKPRVRPPWTIPRVKAAMGLDATFLRDYRALSRRLRVELRHWPDGLMLALFQMGDISERVPEAELGRLRALAAAHGDTVVSGQFDEAYFDTLDEFALFFVYHNVWSSWVSGALKHYVGDRLTAMMRARGDGGRLAMMQALTGLLVLELDQIHRVYALYRQSPALSRLRHAQYAIAEGEG